MKLTWIDAHIHVSDLNPDGTRREHFADELAKVLDQCDADLRLIISCDHPYTNTMYQKPDALAGEGYRMINLMEGNRMIHDLVQRFPGRLFGSCTINPHFLQESLRVMDVCFGEWGFVQLGEMLQYIMSYRMASDITEKIVRKAAQYDVPIQVHIGTYCRPKTDRWHFPVALGVNSEIADIRPATAGMSHLMDLLEIARRVPEAKYILAHAIGCGPTPDCIPWANMLLDTLAGVFPEYPDNFWIEIRDFNAPALKRTLAEVPVKRLLSGTDWTTRAGPPFAPYGTNFEMSQIDPKDRKDAYPACVGSFIKFLKAAGASEETIRRIGSQNACELYRISI